MQYRPQTTGKAKTSWREVEPIDLIFGRFVYLVANLSKTAVIPLTYCLDLI